MAGSLLSDVVQDVRFSLHQLHNDFALQISLA
jgi:hypothetical protein